MQQFKGSEITAETDVCGYPIDAEKIYVVDHVNKWGKPEYTTVEAWNNSMDALAGDFAYLYQVRN